ncbi:endonuclease/exonuclease/phosphatase family protein [Bifidobacterium callimiconis]|nr:endonuclease/exonuclease/phosphatase family protein [Bifidobacterium callimiconis]
MGRIACTALAVILAAATAVGTAARLLPLGMSTMPYVPNIVAATPWFALTAALALLFAVIGRRRLLIVLMVACLGAQAYWQGPFFSSVVGANSSASASSSGASATTLRVMTCNVYKGRADAGEIVRLVRDEQVKVLALQETTKAFVEELGKAGIANYLPYSKTASADGKYGNGVWSAMPLANPVKDEVNSSASFMPAGTVSLSDGRTLRFVSVHTTSPVNGYWNLWKRSIDEIGALDARSGSTYVFMGDFNATYDHAPFRAMLGDRFTDAARQSGHGFTFSWPSDRPYLPMMFSIDHIVLDRGLAASDLKNVKVSGTDHAALLGTIRVG